MPSRSDDGGVALFDIEAEQAVIGAALNDAGALVAATAAIGKTDFYSQAHRLVWAAIQTLQAERVPVDLIAVSNTLRNRGKLDAVGGAGYLAELLNSVHTTALVDAHCAIVAEKARLRRLLEVCQKTIGAIQDGDKTAATIVESAQREIVEIGATRSNTVAKLGNLAAGVFSRVEARYEGKLDDVGKETGFYALDGFLGGLHPGQVIILAARPAMGKTSLALNIVTNIARTYGEPVWVSSLEMTKESLADRIMASEAEISPGRMRHGALNDNDWSKMAGTVARLSDMPVWIDDYSNPTVSHINANCRRVAAEEGRGLGLVVIDYLQLINGEGNGKGANREQEVARISRGLKGMAKDLRCPVIALSQLSRAVESRTNKRPILSDLRESGSVEQDADIVAFIYRDDYYNAESDLQNQAEVIIAKHRSGAVGSAMLYFDKALTKFQSLDAQPVRG